jgi:hypothetical protein
MPLFEVFIKPSHASADIDAPNAKEAARQFVEMLADNLCEEVVEVNPLEDEEDYE